MVAFEIGLLVFGLLLGPCINFAIYEFAYYPRQISPWQALPKVLAARPALARLPVVGWLTRFDEIKLHGRVFWIRPLLIELATPWCLIALYRFVSSGAAIPGGIAVPADSLFHQFYAFAILIALMVVATFIDFDERTIPDWITLPGTVLGMVGGTVFPDWRLYEFLPAVFPALMGTAAPVHANSPNTWSVEWSQGAAGAFGLWLGLFFWSGWCFGMADRRWIDRRGLQKAVIYFFAALRRSPSTRLLLVIWGVGVVGIAVAYFTVSPFRWQGLLSSLFGIGLGGVLVWGFRLVARWAMGQEALGFGDVTLMAMIGAFFGWQVVWIAFFLAPFFGLAFVLIAWLVTGDNATPFGPYLCAATVYAMLNWANLWGASSLLFLPPLLILPILLGLLLMLGAMLWGVQTVKMLLFGSR